MLRSQHFRNADGHSLVHHILCRQCRAEGVDSEHLSSYCTRLLQILATKYPTELDDAIGQCLTGGKSGQADDVKSSSKKAGKRLFELLSKCFAGTRHQPLVYVWPGESASL